MRRRLGLGLGLGPRLLSQIVSHRGPMCPREEIPGHSASHPAHFLGTLGLSRPGPGFEACPVSCCVMFSCFRCVLSRKRNE